MTNEEWENAGRPERRQGERRRTDWRMPFVLFLFGLMLVIGGVSTFAALKAISVTEKIQQEGVERRDQTCVLFEREQLAATFRVVRTYEYLDELPREDYGSNLTRAIVRGLPEQETDARLSQAPPFCDEKTENGREIGLPESKNDPKLPKHRDFSRLLERP